MKEAKVASELERLRTLLGTIVTGWDVAVRRSAQGSVMIDGVGSVGTTAVLLVDHNHPDRIYLDTTRTEQSEAMQAVLIRWLEEFHDDRDATRARKPPAMIADLVERPAALSSILDQLFKRLPIESNQVKLA